MRPLAFSVVALVLLAGCSATTVQPAPYVEILEGATRVTCHGAELDGVFGSRLARSSMLVSPAGDRAAWVEVEAQAIPVGSDEGSCQNISRLWIREGGARSLAFVQRPGWEGRNGNALDLIDWSPDGTRLLFELHTWTYPTDPLDPTLLLWDARTRALEQVDAGARLGERFGADCRFRVRGKGFTPEGTIVVSAETPGGAAASCAEGARLWEAGESGIVAAPDAPSPRWGSTAVPPPVDSD